ncbi:MAG: hypothetical protein ACREQM_04610 [Candidatus Dormibacteraceae bacterium]
MAVALGAVLALAGGAAVPAQASLRAGVPPGQTYRGTLRVRNQAASIQGTVDGNVLADDHTTLTVTGTVTGWVHAYGGSTVTIDGTVDRGVSQSTGSLDVGQQARIGQNLETFTLAAPLHMDGRVASELRASASSVDLARQADVQGDVWVWAKRTQTVQIQGHVGGSVNVSGTNLNLGKDASIGGRVHVWSGKVVRVDGTSAPPPVTSSTRTATLAWALGAAIIVVLAVLIGFFWFRLRRRVRPTT